MFHARTPAEEKTIQNTFRENPQNDNTLLDDPVTETGEIRYTMRNDYLFKAVLQENGAALRAKNSYIQKMY